MSSVSVRMPFCKVVIIGPSKVGKSQFLSQAVDKKFYAGYHETIGADYRFLIVQIDGTPVKLQIWDCAGADRFKTITSAYYRGADAIIAMYSLADAKSQATIPELAAEIDRYAHESTHKILVANKTDLEDEEKNVSAETLMKLASQIHWSAAVKTSALSGVGVQSVLDHIARDFLQKQQTEVKAEPTKIETQIEARLKLMESKNDIATLEFLRTKPDVIEKTEEIQHSIKISAERFNAQAAEVLEKLRRRFDLMEKCGIQILENLADLDNEAFEQKIAQLLDNLVEATEPKVKQETPQAPTKINAHEARKIHMDYLVDSALEHVSSMAQKARHISMTVDSASVQEFTKIMHDDYFYDVSVVEEKSDYVPTFKIDDVLQISW